MDTLKLRISHVKNIQEALIELPFENGLYTIVGANGCGKSTLMLCLAQLLRNQLSMLNRRDLTEDSYVDFCVENKSFVWKYNMSKGCWGLKGDSVKFNGLYEGSLFYGTRFEDSTNIENMIEHGRISHNEITDADDYVKKQLSYILHGDMEHYSTLKRIKNKTVAQNLGIKNRPYFVSIDSNLVSQYRMSSGECLLVSLLHFLYNSIVRRSLPVNQKVIVLIDEIELALHPIAVSRLIDFLNALVKEHSNLIVYLSTHSPEVIRKMPPMNLFKINNDSGRVTIENNCYPSYLIRDMYSTVAPDYLLLVEDALAQGVVNSILSKYMLRSSKLIHCVPVGGWENVLRLHKELYEKKVFGTTTKIISILDGDVENVINKQKDYRNLPHLFLPIPSVEKFLYKIVKKNENRLFRRVLNDKYFIVNSLDEIVSQYNNKVLGGMSDDNKKFYRHLVGELEARGTSEMVFITGLCDDIMTNINCTSFKNMLEKILQS